MNFTIVTLFPGFFDSSLGSGLLAKAISKGIVNIRLANPRDYAQGKHRPCDDSPYGGGSGMVMMPEPLFRALDDADPGVFTVLATPSGRPLTQAIVKEFAAKNHIRIICGHYEGIDERVSEKYVDMEISIGDYVLSGGEYAALVLVDAVSRYQPGFMGNGESLKEESFEDGLLEYPHYTRPAEIEGMNVPDVLMSGNHAEIEKWRSLMRIEKTKRVRPDLYKNLSEKQGE